MNHHHSKGLPAAGLNDEDGPDAEVIADFLRMNPDFLVQNPDLISGLRLPSKWGGEGVVDMQQFMLERLREDIENLSICAQDVIETSRNNMTNQTRTHAAALALLGADSFTAMVRTIVDDLALLLDVDVVSIGFERPAIPNPALISADIRTFPPGYVDVLMTGEDVLLLREASDDGTVFGGGAGLVRSAAIARLRPGGNVPAGAIAFGVRQVDAFHPGQGTELVTFLARMVERLTYRWLTALQTTED